MPLRGSKSIGKAEREKGACVERAAYAQRHADKAKDPVARREWEQVAAEWRLLSLMLDEAGVKEPARRKKSGN